MTRARERWWQALCGTPVVSTARGTGYSDVDAVGEERNVVGDAVRIELPARPENVAVIRREAASYAKELGMAPGRLADLKTIVSEACGNVVRYAYDADEAGGVLQVEIARAGDQVEVCVRDEGRGISPITESVAPGGGFGLPLIGALSSRLRIDSRLGVGTEMRISIPISAQ